MRSNDVIRPWAGALCRHIKQTCRGAIGNMLTGGHLSKVLSISVGVYCAVNGLTQSFINLLENLNLSDAIKLSLLNQV